MRVVILVGAVFLVGCGGSEPRLAQTDAQPLIALTAQIVYEAWHEKLERRVALKVLAAHLADDDEFRTRFLREARIAARLSHPNLVRTYDIDEHDGLPCIVMELLPGGTLEGGSLTREEASQVAAGLAHAHAQGVVHRDLKPANILR